jgi:hypothetical protein
MHDAVNKHLALQIAIMLPDDPRDAHAVLDRARELLDGFLFAEDKPADKPFTAGNVVPFGQPTP